jgi:large subunit ribosomal protein L20
MRVTLSVPSRKRRKRVLKRAKGFYGASSKRIRTAYDAVNKAGQNAYIGRKQKKRQYRSLWTVRINTACRELGTTYSVFINALAKAGSKLNRKVLADMAVTDFEAFKALVKSVSKPLATK